MSGTDDRTDLARYRTEYLQLKTALQDRVTDLPVYTVLVDRLRTLLDDKRQIGVLHLEIGQLDLVESLYGWQVLDGILARTAGSLRSLVGSTLPEDTLLAVNTVAGDRFLAFVPALDQGSPVEATGLARLGKEIENRLEEVFDTEEYDGLNPRLTFRSGHALLSENPYSRFERRVHGAIEEARILPEKMARRRELSSREELKRIVSESAVTTVYHPVVELDSERIIGYEALSRGPQGSMFEMPHTMFALSGKAGVETELDRVCRKAALENCAFTPGGGKLFLNVLAGSLSDPDWHNGTVGGFLHAHSMTPADLVLEISERRAEGRPERTVEAVEALKRAGFRIALDDVGTGYSSLETMERVRPHYVKIDTSLVRGIEANLIQQEALQSLVNIAQRLGSAVVAEGIETHEESLALSSLGVRYGQGFLFSRPAPMVDGGLTIRPRGMDH